MPKLVNSVCLHGELTPTNRPPPPTFPDRGVRQDD
jgi:hypothetical protein